MRLLSTDFGVEGLDRRWLCFLISLWIVPLGVCAALEPELDQKSGLTDNTAWWVTQDHRGFLWIATMKGVNRYDGHNIKQFVHDPDDPSSIAADSVSEILVSRDGTVWFATWGGGVDRFDPGSQAFIHHAADPRDPDALHDGRAQTLLQTRDGMIWVGTAGSGLARLDPDRGTFRRFHEQDAGTPVLPHGRVWDLAETQDGKLMVATGKGIALFNPATGRTERRLPEPELLSQMGDGVAHAIHLDEDGLLWVGTGQGLFRVTPQGRVLTGLQELHLRVPKPPAPALRPSSPITRACCGSAVIAA